MVGSEQLTVNRNAIIECSWIRILRRKPIVYRNDLHLSESRHVSCFTRTCVTGIQHVSTAVKMQEDTVFIFFGDDKWGQNVDLHTTNHPMIQRDAKLLTDSWQRSERRRRETVPKVLPFGFRLWMDVPLRKRRGDQGQDLTTYGGWHLNEVRVALSLFDIGDFDSTRGGLITCLRRSGSHDDSEQ